MLNAHGPEAAPLRDVTFSDITVKQAQKPLELVNVSGLRFDNLVIGDSRVDGRLSWQ